MVYFYRFILIKYFLSTYECWGFWLIGKQSLADLPWGNNQHFKSGHKLEQSYMLYIFIKLGILSLDRIISKCIMWCCSLSFLKFEGKCNTLRFFRRKDFNMNGRDRSSFGEEINYGTFKLIYIKGIYNFLIKFSIEPSSDLSK